MDNDGYPDDDELESIKAWPPSDLDGCMEYVRERWKYADSGFFNHDKGSYKLSTGGWSGNEEIIGALHENVVWWMMYWQSSARGGKHVFEALKVAVDD